MPFSPAVLGHQMPSVSGQYRKALTTWTKDNNLTYRYKFEKYQTKCGRKQK